MEGIDDLIIRYLEKFGTTVADVLYFDEEEDVGTFDVGVSKGYEQYKVFLFGNISINMRMTGATLSNRNSVIIGIGDVILGGVAKSEHHYENSIGNGFQLLGDGSYLCEKRIYGVGFNRVVASVVDGAGTTVTYNITMNGILYVMK